MAIRCWTCVGSLEGGFLKQTASGIAGMMMSRPHLESHVRRRAKAISNLQFVEDRKVDSLEHTGNHVTGVKCGDEVLPADLVVDCTGRGTHTPQWLEALGYGRPPEERVEVDLAYATRLFRRTGQEMGGNTGVIMPPTPTGKRGGVLLAQEDDRWTLTLIGHFGNVPPVDLAGFLDYAASLPHPLIHEIVSRAEPLDSGAAIRYPASVRRQYEKMSRFPEGLLVLGDALCSFNPIYGQGMSASALEAAALQQALREGTKQLAQRFLMSATVVDNPWAIAVGSDLRMPEARPDLAVWD